MDLDALYVHDVAHRSGSIPLLTCNCPGCWLMSARDAHPDELPIFVVYDKPRDALESVIVRLWLTDGATAGVWQFLDVDDANHTLEQLGLVWMPRQADDEPQIVGSWIMTIEIRDGTYFAALWYLDSDVPRRGNWMGALFRNPDGSWEVVYRFRYYVDDITDETSEDEKSWHRLKKPSGDDSSQIAIEMEEGVDRMLEALHASGYGRGFEIQKIQPRSDRTDVVMAMLTANSFAHVSSPRSSNPVPISMRPVVRGQA